MYSVGLQKKDVLFASTFDDSHTAELMQIELVVCWLDDDHTIGLY